MVKKKDYMVCKGCLKSYPKTIKESLVTVGFFDWIFISHYKQQWFLKLTIGFLDEKTHNIAYKSY